MMTTLPCRRALVTLAVMMHRLRQQLRALAASALVLVSVLGAWSTFAHGFDCHDHDDGPVVVVHDASAHAFRSTAPSEGERPIHCVLCHWTRIFGPGVQSVTATPSLVTHVLWVPSADIAVARLNAAAQPPLRAPPSASMLHLFA
jgi:hypothetical protein